MKILIATLTAFLTMVSTATAETILFKAAYGEPWPDYIKITVSQSGGLSLQADFGSGQLEEGIIDTDNIDDLKSVMEYTEFPYIHDGIKETIAFQINDTGVLEAGLPGAIWLLRVSYLPGTAPPKRPWVEK